MRPELQAWTDPLKEARGHLHRKVWEWCFIAEALAQRGMLAPGRRGLGFAVGQEPLTALFASRGARIVATDLYADEAAAKGWVETGQHASGYAAINQRGICDEATLRERVEFRFADMNDIPPQLHGNFDFVWSSCAFEHLGTLEKGKQFVLNAMHCVRPGGVAVHTTEFNVSSNKETVEEGETVLYRRRDIEDLVRRLRRAGHRIKVRFDTGNSVSDATIDVPPYKHDVHLKLQIGRYVATSIGLIITKSDGRLRWWPFGA
jgi:2-polyprenyl-3-methyl-5-hydroxy-6-metoxy-1,4-benzoquinol methylase